MLSDAPLARKAAQRHRTWMSSCETLEALAAELRRYGLRAALVPDQELPYVRVHPPCTTGDRVTLTRHDGDDAYAWSIAHGKHPAIDPAGCARRIATQLRHGQRVGGAA